MRLGLQGLAGVSRWGTGVFRDKTRIAGQGAPGSPGVGLRVRTSAGPGPRAQSHAVRFLWLHARPL